MYVSALISNQACLLQYSGGDGDAGPTGSQHVSQKLLRQRHKIRADTVLAHQQPAGQPFIDLVKAVARSHLGSLHSQDLHIALQEVCQGRRLANNLGQILAVDPEASGLDLDDRPGGTGAEADDKGQSDKTLFTRQSDFHTLALGQNGKN